MKKLFATLAILFCFAGTTTAAFAQITLDKNLQPGYAAGIDLTGSNKSSANTPATYGNYFLQLIAGGLLYLAGPTAILFIALAGLRYVTARGDQTALEEAKKTLTWAIIGLVIIILSWAIVRTVIQVTVQANQPTPPPSSSTGAAGGTPGSGIPSAPPSGSSPDSTLGPTNTPPSPIPPSGPPAPAPSASA